MLVSSKLPAIDKPEDTVESCTSSRCLCCAYMTNDTVITRTTATHHVNGNFTCKSANLVYLIRCQRGCPEAWYVGETCQKLHERMNGHRRDTRQAYKKKHQPDELTMEERQKPPTPVGDHFSKLNHTHSDILLTVLQGGLPDMRPRKVMEQKYIKFFDTHKTGLNKDLSFMTHYTD
jgi:hypothetical protein